jgi:hypothetical protein
VKASDEYLLVRGSFEEVQKQVNNALADGWVPLGAPFRTGAAVETGFLCQEREVPELAQALVCGDTASRLERKPPL